MASCTPSLNVTLFVGYTQLIAVFTTCKRFNAIRKTLLLETVLLKGIRCDFLSHKLTEALLSNGCQRPLRYRGDARETSGFAPHTVNQRGRRRVANLAGRRGEGGGDYNVEKNRITTTADM
ncbi:hypothetical protein J6590_017327 [Homalodisca vitripennis]|nr:hypothetical protein J6590_017327 [Homalodisca vitripennis]